MTQVHRVTVFTALLSAAGASLLLAPTSAQAVLSSVATTNVGNETHIVSATLSDGRVQGPGTGLIGIDVFHYRNVANNSTVMVVADGSAVPANGSRAALLDGDLALNTGIINPGGSGGIAAGLSPTATTEGIGINFNAPVINGPGDDFIIFDLTVGAGQTGDPVQISALSDGSGFGSVSAGTANFISGNYTVHTDQLNHRTVTQSLPVNNLNDLETKAAALAATGDTFFRAMAVDLSTMGVAVGDSVTGLFIQGTLIDPTFVAGLTPTTQQGLIQVNTSNTGGVTNVDSVIVGRGGGFEEIQAADLVAVDVFHWHAPSGGNTALSVGGTDPGAGNRAAALMEDFGLNTGMINSGDSGTLSIAQQALLGPDSTSSNGLGVNFVGGLVNGEGIDLIVFEYADLNAQDHFRINRIDGIVGDLIINPADYDLRSSANLATQLMNANSSTLNLFESGIFNPNGEVTQGWYAIGIDLSDLGYAHGQVAPGLFFSDAPGTGNADIVFIAGLPSNVVVPEPGTLGLLSLGMVALMRRKRHAA